MPSPRISVEVPSEWLQAELRPPRIAESTGAVLSEWSARRNPAGDAALVSGCVATPIPGWVEDMRPAVEARTLALAGASATSITEVPMDARPEQDGSFALRAASDLGGPVLGRTRTFIGFDESRVVTCFVTCAARTRGADHEGCVASVASATLIHSLPPPKAALWLRAATWGVHHPKPVAIGGAVLLVVMSLLAMIFRRRPRTTMAAPPPVRARRSSDLS